MDKDTQRYYTTYAADVSVEYSSGSGRGVLEYTDHAFPKGCSVLEIGAGSGRDMDYLLRKGYDIYGVDASEEMVNAALTRYPGLDGRIKVGSIPSQELYFDRTFDAVLCSAMIMHVPDEELFDSLYTIRNHLNEEGTVLFSYPLERPGLDAQGRSSDGRLFMLRPPAEYALIFERLGFRSLFNTEQPDSLGRAGYTWGVTIFQLDSARSRSIDKVESILNRDRKTATYKLALLRALTDIASHEYNNSTWRMDGTIAVPLQSIVEKWLIYYWSIAESQEFIPQINGESASGGSAMRFRKSLSSVVERYRSDGVMKFLSDYRSNALSDDEDVTTLMKEIATAIIKGPVQFAGGALNENLFSYDRKDESVLVPAEIWNELCLMGYWIRDSLLLRWAELTSRISKGQISVAQMTGVLLSGDLEGRSTVFSREIFSSMDTMECIWSGKTLQSSFEIDHLLPYSLWHNNDIWNMLPADPTVNNRKRDKLPTRSLLEKRKDHFIHYWQYLSEVVPHRFSLEMARFTGKRKDHHWEQILFHTFVDAVEMTALQRGVERWEV